MCWSYIFIYFGEGDYVITPVSSHKLLGTHLDNTLSWDKHVNALCGKIKSRLYIFNKIKYLLPPKCRLDYFNGLVQPLIDFNCVVWGNCRKELLLKVHKAMKMFGRSILDVKKAKDRSSLDIFKTLNWLPVDSRINYFEGIQMYKIVNGDCPQYMKNMIKSVHKVHNVNTRWREDSKNLYIRRTNLETGKRAFDVRGPTLWNNLDSSIQNATTIDTFKRNYHKLLAERAFNGSKLKLDMPKYHTE